MKKSIVLKYGLILLLLLSFISCSVLKKKKNCDCPEWSYYKTEKLKKLTKTKKNEKESNYCKWLF